uniref:beta-1,3-galactosyltransferase 1-like n=1 Tax=Ciona intestinalis TaxID=7719 RepID=UPI00089DBAF0|nr:beta-1,3-galactosyltransferase 1-like [Ciona intestinalis]|eukprot:XP_018672879.1 beta-1,3-galactosyltransferase 1-like [Ciona intestinalis]
MRSRRKPTAFLIVTVAVVILINFSFYIRWFPIPGRIITPKFTKPDRDTTTTEITAHLKTEAEQVDHYRITVIRPPLLTYNCSESSENVVMCLVNFMLSSSTNFALRQTIRETVGTLSFLNGLSIKNVFVVAKSTEENVNTKILEESDANKDILFIDHFDSYRKIVYKTLAILQWSSENLPPSYFVSKSDDDVRFSASEMSKHMLHLLNPGAKEIISMEDRLRRIENFPILCGHTLLINPRTCRDRNSIYYLSPEEYQFDFFPDYCNGAMYLMPVSTAKRLFQQVRAEQIIRMEDVWATGILRSKLSEKDQIVKREPAFATHFPHLNTSQLQARTIKFHQAQLREIKNYNLSYCC